MLTSIKSLEGLQEELNAAQIAACETYLRSPQFIETVNFDYLGHHPKIYCSGVGTRNTNGIIVAKPDGSEILQEKI
jgi:hypothetical protein